MALNLTVIREALAAQITAGTGREVRGYPYPTGSINELPCVVVRCDDDYVNYHATQGEAADVGLVIDVMAACRASIEDGLRVLDELLSSAAGQPTSVIDAIEADDSLGGAVERVVVGTAGQQTGFGTVEDGRPIGVIASVPVEVWVNRS